MELATFGAGCFWGVEHILRQQAGVIDAISGYSGGKSANPTYEEVCSGRSGHVEVVQVTFDPTKITYDQLLSIFFRLHNPTQVNGQGPDIGEQYRSVIFYQSEAQKASAEKLIADLTAAKKFKRPIATAVEPFAKFWPAEEYHQKYYQRKGTEPYCHALRDDY
ncbi:MAG: peptide-methionine (S)-S-oxide reductase MsrA [Phycisphaerales bacterium]|nr:peptide-methionine (S)-S-oxide reductase MsrA [Phycisphaerales bacterium]